MSPKPIFSLVLLAFGATDCSRFHTARDTTKATKASPWILKFPLPDPSDNPRWELVHDLESPRLSQLGSLRTRCSSDGGAVVVGLDQTGWNCAKFLGAKVKDVAELTLSCTEQNDLRIELKGVDKTRRCPSAAVLKRWLGRIRIPGNALTGLSPFNPSENFHFKPDISRFAGYPRAPELWFTNQGPWTLRMPDLHSWLGTASQDAWLRLAIKLHRTTEKIPDAKLDAKALDALKSFIASAKAPAYLKFFLGGTPAKSELLPPLVNVAPNYQGPLEQSACDYLGKWIRGRQVLAGVNLDDPKRLDIDCFFDSFDDLDTESAFTVTRLALPYSFGDPPIFPFRRSADAMNPLSFENLKGVP